MPNSPTKTNPQFIQSIHAGLRYWQQKTQELGPDQVRWLDKRRRNLFQAVLFGLQTKETWEDTATVLLQTFDYVEWGGYGQEWIPVLEQALAYSPDSESFLYGRLQNRLGQLYRLGHRYDEATKLHQKALQLAQQLAHKELEMVAYAGLSEVSLAQRAIAQTEEFAQQALAIAQTVDGMERMQAFMLKVLGDAASYVGNWTKAIHYYQNSINLWRVLNNVVYLGRTLCQLGIVYINSGNFVAAEQALEQASEVFRPTLNESDKINIYMNLGVMFYRQEKWEEAANAFLQINPTILRERQELYLLASLHNNLGNVYAKLMSWEKSIENLQIAIKMFRTTKSELQLANSLGTLAGVYVSVGKQTEAVSYYEKAITLLKNYQESAWGQKLLAEFTAEFEALT